MEKTNRGLIVKNCPQICVDKFTTSGLLDIDGNLGRAFFLTHYDDDTFAEILSHEFLDQIGDNSKTNRLYLHKVAFHLLKYWSTTHLYDIKLNVDELESKLDELVENEKIVLLETNFPVQLEFGYSNLVTVTPLSSGSNAGCIMLLIENEQERILYTGSCRLSLNDLRQCSPLHNSDGTVKKLDKIYLDTTYCLEHVKELPTRSKAVKLLSSLILECISLDKTKQLEFATDREMKINNLYCLQKLAELTKQVVHVPYELASFLSKLNGFRNIISSRSNDSTHIHYDCAESCDNEECSPSDDLDFQDDFEVSPISIGCEMSYMFGRQAKPKDEIEWVNNDGKSIYTTEKFGVSSFHGIYSNHLSFNEMGRMLNYLNVNPSKVLPLFVRHGMNSEEIEIALEFACDAETELEDLLNEDPSCNFDFTEKNVSKNYNLDSRKKYLH